MNERDYSLTGENNLKAIESGLANADWYHCRVDKKTLKKLLARKNGPAIRDTLIWFTLLGISGYLGYIFWETTWFLVPFLFYSVFYASVSDSRWHETSHGTAFKTDWMNDVVYEISSFMVFRESTTWRWSHTRHHTDTIIVGRDPEIAAPRPIKLLKFFIAFIKLSAMWQELKNISVHACGKKTSAAADFVPENEWPKIFFKARIYLAIYSSVIALSVYTASWLPLMYVGIPSIIGSWLTVFYGYTQHTGLAENVTDHRLNCRTVECNLLNRYLYWNMNFHTEHHMFPLVPYHALPQLHQLIKDDCPKPYASMLDAWREILPAVFKQARDPNYYVSRQLPEAKPQLVQESNFVQLSDEALVDDDGWLAVGDITLLENEDVIRVDHQRQTYAVYRNDQGQFYATEGICTHGNTHLADGMVKGNLIECAKHNGRFDITDGSIQRAPVCINLKTFPTKTADNKLFINIKAVEMVQQPQHEFRVVSNENIATYIKELVLSPINILPKFSYQPGDYLQFNIPEYEKKSLKDIIVGEKYADTWQINGAFSQHSENKSPVKRNYSFASNPEQEQHLSFYIRLALAPASSGLLSGVGSSYMFNLKAGDIVSANGPFGDFRIKDDSHNEMLYLGGGAGMAPLRSHLSYLLESQKTQRKVSFWYGARSEQEVIYRDYFEQLAQKHENFSFHIALSDAHDQDDQSLPRGFVHQVLFEQYLSQHSMPQNVQYYLCGPPPMMSATRELLAALQVPKANIAFDEF